MSPQRMPITGTGRRLLGKSYACGSELSRSCSGFELGVPQAVLLTCGAAKLMVGIRARLIELFTQHGVEYVLCGHTHTTTDVRGGGLHVYTVGGTAKVVDSLGCGYNIITITADSVVISYRQLDSDNIDNAISPCCQHGLTADIAGQCPRCTMDPEPPPFDTCTEYAPAPPRPPSSGGSGGRR